MNNQPLGYDPKDATSIWQYSAGLHQKIVLIDGSELAKYMIEYNVGVSVKKVYEVKRIDTDYFDE
jgi:restriction system protein